MEFIASNITDKNIRRNIRDIKVYVPVVIGEQVTPIESFEAQSKVEWVSQLNDITGEVTLDGTVRYRKSI